MNTLAPEQLAALFFAAMCQKFNGQTQMASILFDMALTAEPYVDLSNDKWLASGIEQHKKSYLEA